jgi:hypothetical protein
MKHVRLLAVLVLLGSTQAFPSPRPAANVSGTVRIKGEIPKPKRIRMDIEKHCSAAVKGQEIAGEDIVADPKGNVKWAFVYVKSGLEGQKFEVPKTPVVVQQQTCRYVPHVAGVMVGQDFVMRSGDPVIHIPHVRPKNSREWGFSQAKVGEERAKQFPATEVMVRLICDVHQWMEAWIGVLDHPFYAVSDDKGKFEIKNLPPGKYVIEAWHELYQPVTQEIEVGASSPKPLSFEFTERLSR